MVRTAPARHDCSRPSADCSRPSALCGRRDEQGIVYLVFTPAAPRGSDVDALFRSYSADYRAAHRLDLSLVSGLVVGVTVVALADRLRATSRRAVSWAAILRGGRRHWTPRWLATFCAAGLAALGPRPRPPSSHARVGSSGRAGVGGSGRAALEGRGRDARRFARSLTRRRPPEVSHGSRLQGLQREKSAVPHQPLPVLASSRMPRVAA